jgi:NADPH-dependent 2,4-dienoyl-CoA reductase/sulfur reductase-like enzyme
VPEVFAIVGASLAEGGAAYTLCEEGFDGRTILIGAEPYPPYERVMYPRSHLPPRAPCGRVYVERKGVRRRENVGCLWRDDSDRENNV